VAADLLSTSLQYVRGVGPKRAADLARAGLLTVEDLLLRFPLRYEDRAAPCEIRHLRPGMTATVTAEVISSGVRATRRPGFRLFEAIVRDASGGITKAVFPNQAFLKDVFVAGQRVVLFGPLEFRPSGGLQFTNPEYELIRTEGEDDDGSVHTGRIVPIYEKIGSMTPRMQRVLVHRLLLELPAVVTDPVPEPIRVARQLPDRVSAIRGCTFRAGASIEALNAFMSAAHHRLIFEEFFLFQAGMVMRKRLHANDRKPHPVVVDDRIRDAARKILPFKLTDGQKTALREIVTDMRRDEPMNRLLQGDVGAGKTIVALMAALVAMENGLQVAFMAPTEILADQHYLTIRRLLEHARFRVVSLTGSLSAAKRREVRAEIASGTAHLVVGTHALAEADLAFQSLGIVIIDEQHRFAYAARQSAVERPASRRVGHDGDAHSAHARAHDVRRPRRVGDSRTAARSSADCHRLEERVEARRDLSVDSQGTRGRASGVRDLSAGRRFGEGRPARRHGDGRSSAAGSVSGVPRGAAPWSTEAGRERPRDERVRARRGARARVDDRC
jgi:ATP-dependent DNA helicase RecG